MELSTLDILIRLVVAAILSAVIGFERESNKKPAGMRTNALVGLGTAMVTIASLMVVKFGGVDAVDVSRLAASILPGIGFIGAGTIIRSGGSVKGLTTAASIWVVAAIGIATGLGLYDLAVIGTILGLIALIALPRLPDEETK
ncbi:MgtC/SapB family protein [bacterium]|nr:MgtC/SapB family protein [bacterium]